MATIAPSQTPGAFTLILAGVVAMLLLTLGILELSAEAAPLVLGAQPLLSGGQSALEEPLAPPGAPWPVLPAEELAAAAASYPVTLGPPAAPVPYVPLLAALRRRNAGLHPAGAKAPIRGVGKVTILVPHMRPVPDVWRQRFPFVSGLSESTATAMPLDMATPLPLLPLAMVRSQPLQAPKPSLPYSFVHTGPMAISEEQETLGKSRLPDFWAKQDPSGDAAFLFFAIAALVALGRQAYQVLEKSVGSTFEVTKDYHLAQAGKYSPPSSPSKFTPNELDLARMVNEI